MRDQTESRLARTMPARCGSVRLVSLSEAVERIGSDADLLKLNCEGAEWDIFEDTDAFQKIHLIRMEYYLTDDRRLDDLRVCAAQLGFRIDRLVLNAANEACGYAWFSRKD